MFQPSITFRAMQKNDLEKVNSIEQYSADHPWRMAHFADSLKSGYICELVLLNEYIVGHCVMNMMVTGEASIAILTIDKNFQRRGIGRRLLQHMLKKAFRFGCTTILLEVRRSNTRALNLYLYEGFSEVGIRKNYYPMGKNREDAIIMAIGEQTFSV